MQPITTTLRQLPNKAGDLDRRFIHASTKSFSLADILGGTSLGEGECHGRSVLLATAEQLSAALALIELDGVARRIVICPPDITADQIDAVITDANVDTIVTDSSYRRIRSDGFADHRLREGVSPPTPHPRRPKRSPPNGSC